MSDLELAQFLVSGSDLLKEAFDRLTNMTVDDRKDISSVGMLLCLVAQTLVDRAPTRATMIPIPCDN